MSRWPRSASPVGLRIGCGGRNLKFRLDMHSISVRYRRPKALCGRGPARLRSAVEECAGTTSRGPNGRLGRRRSQRFSLRGRPPGTKKEKFSDRRPPRSGIHARLAQNGVWDRDNHARKSRSQCTDPDAAHSRDDRGRDDSAHRDADYPKAIGITLIDAVRDQHHSQP